MTLQDSGTGTGSFEIQRSMTLDATMSPPTLTVEGKDNHLDNDQEKLAGEGEPVTDYRPGLDKISLKAVG